MEKSFRERAITIRLPGPPVDVDLSNDGTRVAVATATPPRVASVCVYDTATGEQVTSFATEGNFGKGVAFGQDGQSLYALVAEASGYLCELRRFALDGGASASLWSAPSSEAHGLVRNQATDLLAVQGHDVQVLHDQGSSLDVVRIIPGLEARRIGHAQFPAKGAYVYCTGVAKDQFVRWDLQDNRQDGGWPALSCSTRGS